MEAQALERVKEADIAAGKRPKRVLDLDVGYHLELEAANKRLEMDNRLMAPRVSLLDIIHAVLIDSWKTLNGKSTGSSPSCAISDPTLCLPPTFLPLSHST